MEFFEDTSSPTAASPAQAIPASSPMLAASETKTALRERGAAAVAEQDQAIERRIASHQSDRSSKDAAIKKEASAHLQDAQTRRSESISAAKSEHRESQSATLALRDELASKGALWPSVLMLVDASKPNPHSKRGTEVMRSTFAELEAGKVAICQK